MCSGDGGQVGGGASVGEEGGKSGTGMLKRDGRPRAWRCGASFSAWARSRGAEASAEGGGAGAPAKQKGASEGRWGGGRRCLAHGCCGLKERKEVRRRWVVCLQRRGRVGWRRGVQLGHRGRGRRKDLVLQLWIIAQHEIVPAAPALVGFGSRRRERNRFPTRSVRLAGALLGRGGSATREELKTQVIVVELSRASGCRRSRRGWGPRGRSR